MPKIQQLSPHVADLIAAGEVVERPGSVVKELVENSIDAGAKHVTVEIKNGGMTFLRVTDDGCGMSAEDAPTAFLRHATSKLRTAGDLAAIGTLGFRGEALAAICAVSKVELLTREAGAESGTSLTLTAGDPGEVTPAGCPCGTTILVRDLFYNTPARMKFMKRDSVEGAAVHAAVLHEALAHPEVSIRLIRDGQEQLSTAGDGSLQSAVYAALGRQFALELVPVSSSWEQYGLSGFVTKPTASRGSRSYQHFFVNGRYIKSKLLAAALEQAYANQIMTGRFPGCVLELKMPVTALDVNVHPAKTEVKFLSEREVFDCVHYGVLSALNKAPGRPAVSERHAAQPKPEFFQTMTAADYRRAAPILEKAASASPAPETARAVFSAQQEPKTTPSAPAPFRTAVPSVPERQTALPVHDSVRPQTPRPAPAPEPKVSEPPAPAQETLPLAPVRPWRLVGEVLQTYLIVEQDGKVLLIDKHAAHERVIFEKFRARREPVMAQSLLTPLTPALSREEAAAVLENAKLLEQFGFFAEDFGGGDVLVRQIPAELDPDGAEAALAELAANLLEGRRADPGAIRDGMLHTIACKAAVKAGSKSDEKELYAIAKAVLERDDIKYCPHGRPVCVTMTKSFFETQFKR